jgi:hypothetical protein
MIIAEMIVDGEHKIEGFASLGCMRNCVIFYKNLYGVSNLHVYEVMQVPKHVRFFCSTRKEYVDAEAMIAMQSGFIHFTWKEYDFAC